MTVDIGQDRRYPPLYPKSALSATDSSRRNVRNIEQLRSYLRPGNAQVDGREPDRVPLYENGLVDPVPADRRVKQNSGGAPGKGVASLLLRAEIRVYLVDVPASQGFLPVPPLRQQRIEFRVDNDPVSGFRMFENDIRAHRREDLRDPGGSFFYLPIKAPSRLHAPSVRSQRRINACQGEIKLLMDARLRWQGVEWEIVGTPWMLNIGMILRLRREKDGRRQHLWLAADSMDAQEWRDLRRLISQQSAQRQH